MAELIHIIRVVVGTQYLTATVQLSEDCPVMTSEDLEGTTRVYNLLPTIIDHACVGDAGATFKDCMGDTEIAHLLEHVTVELLARTNMVDETIAGRTWRELAYDRTFSVRFNCVDDVLVAGALSSAVWIMEWAFSGGEGLVPDVEATVMGLADLVQSLPDPSLEAKAPEGFDGMDGLDEPFDMPFDAPFDEPLDEPGNDYRNDAPYDEYGYEDEDLDRGPRMSRKII